MGAVRTVLNIMSGQSLELTRDIEVGGNTATLAIARALGVSFAEAEKRKEAGDPSAKELITPLAVVLSRELRSTFSYVSSKMNKNVGKIYLSGGCAMLQGLKEVLSSDFGMEVLLWNPLQGFHPSLRAPADYVQGKEPLLAIAAGLAATD
jgi:type IV pilus assembly protein PilM